MKKTNRVLALGLLLPLAASVSAAVIPVRLPGMVPLTPTVPVLSLPSFPAPVEGPRRLPSAPFEGSLQLPGAPLPLPLPPQPLELPSQEIHLDWSFLDGDAGTAPVVAPRGRGPKPLPPAGASAALKFASEGAKKGEGLKRVGDELFDHARPRVLLVEAL